MVEKPHRISLDLRTGGGPLSGGPLSGGMILGIFLVLCGTLLFIDNLDVLPFSAFALIWPLSYIVGGTIFGMRTGSLAVRIWSGAAVLGGILLLLREFGVLHIRGSIVWPLGLISAGVVMLIYRLNWTPRADRISFAATHDSKSSEHRLNEAAVFGGVKRRVESAAFEGGELTAVFGGIEVDLRRSALAGDPPRTILEANAAFGGIEIRVPETWRVAIEGTAVFGQFEDKTIPPRPEPGIVPPVLIVRGGVAFGGVVLMN